MRGSIASGLITSGQWAWIGCPTRSVLGIGPITTSIYCHGSGGHTRSVTAGDEFGLVMALAEDRFSIVGDFGGETWGNDTGVSLVHTAVQHARTNHESIGPVVLIGTSMGFLTATNYARVHPEEVAAIAGIIPAIDIQNLIDIVPTSKPAIDAAYGGTYSDSIHRAHSPIHMAEDGLLPENLPIKIWSLPSDTLATPATQYAFVAQRPQTEIVDITAPGTWHGPIAVKAVKSEVLSWIKEKTHE